MTVKSIFLTGFVVPLLVLSTSAFADKQAEEQKLMMTIQVLEINDNGLPDPVIKVLAAPTLVTHRGIPVQFLSGGEFKVPGDKDLTGLGLNVKLKPGPITLEKKGNKTVKTVRVDLRISHSSLQQSEKVEFQIDSTSSRIIKVFQLDKKERIPYGNSGNQFIELTISEWKWASEE